MTQEQVDALWVASVLIYSATVTPDSEERLAYLNAAQGEVTSVLAVG